MEVCDLLLQELSMFSTDILELGNKVSESKLHDFENKIGLKLPNDFKYIICKHNGFSLLGTNVLGINNESKSSSLEDVYNFEHEQTFNKMPKEYIPFSPDGYGNHYCMDVSNIETDYCPIVFWQHDIHYDSFQKVEVCNDSFVDWVKEVVIDWTLEDYNYDGSEKQLNFD